MFKDFEECVVSNTFIISTQCGIKKERKSNYEGGVHILSVLNKTKRKVINRKLEKKKFVHSYCLFRKIKIIQTT